MQQIVLQIYKQHKKEISSGSTPNHNAHTIQKDPLFMKASKDNFISAEMNKINVSVSKNSFWEVFLLKTTTNPQGYTSCTS